MKIRSKLLATVVLPALSASVMMQPVHAQSLSEPAILLAQDSGEQDTDAEILRQQQAEEMQRAAAEAQRQAEEQQRAAEEETRRNAEEQQRAAQQEADRQAQEQQRAAEQAQREAAEQQRAADEQNAIEEEARRKQAEDAARQAAEQQKAAEEQAKREAEQQQKAADEQAQRQAEEQKQAEEKARREAAEQQPCVEQQKAVEDEAKRKAREAAETAAQDKAPSEPQPTPQADPQPPVPQQPQPQPETQPQTPAPEPDAARPEQPAAPAQQSDRPPLADSPQAPADTAAPANTDPDGGAAPQPLPPENATQKPQAEIIDERTPEVKQQIARDPASTDETVVLPVDNGAAILDSDKDADNFGGQQAREQRRKMREQQRAADQQKASPPADDAAAQGGFAQELTEAMPKRIEANLKEEGQRINQAPAFAVPETTNIVNNTIVNNTVVNNTVQNNQVTNVKVIEQIDDRVILDAGDRIFVRGDDRPRLRRDAQETYYDQLSRGRMRETIVRPGGYEIVTIYDRYGDILQRSRIDRDGNEYLMIYAPDDEETPRAAVFDVGYDLPPMRLTIPVRDYIIDVAEDPERDFYDFLALPPVERVERVYTIDEVRHSARLRDKVRRIDLDTIHFATGSAEVSLSQAKTLRKVANAMQKVLAKDPGETFFIEGHTDAVGSDRSNLVLSDRRAESVANLLTEVYDIPAENLVTQGYGERFLKIRTQAAEQENRRVTIRRVTPLVRPVAQR